MERFFAACLLVLLICSNRVQAAAAEDAHQSPKRALTILINLSTSLLEAGNFSQAERILLLADELLSKAPNALAEAEIINNWVNIHLRLGRYFQAKAESERALHLVENIPSAIALMPNLLDGLATSEIYLGEYSQALRHQQDAIERWQILLPPDHPDLVKGYSVLSTAQFLSGHIKEARLSLETAIASADRLYGPQSPQMALLLRDEIIVLTRLGLKSEARIRNRKLSRILPLEDTTSVVYTSAGR